MVITKISRPASGVACAMKSFRTDSDNPIIIPAKSRTVNTKDHFGSGFIDFPCYQAMPAGTSLRKRAGSPTGSIDC